jgi:hypothetical protein
MRHFGSVMVASDVSRELNCQLLNCVRLQLHSLRRIRGDRIGDVILRAAAKAQALRAKGNLVVGGTP